LHHRSPLPAGLRAGLEWIAALSGLELSPLDDTDYTLAVNPSACCPHSRRLLPATRRQEARTVKAYQGRPEIGKILRFRMDNLTNQADARSVTSALLQVTFILLSCYENFAYCISSKMGELVGSHTNGTSGAKRLN
jgi:hypothetical protein